MDLTTNYLGMALCSPLVLSASPLSMNVEKVKRMADAGASAVVLGSLFEEQIAHDTEELEYFLEYGADRFAESLSYYPQVEQYAAGPQQYLDHIAALKRAVDIPVIASLNGVSAGGWIDYAAEIEKAGADALELNIYFLPTNPAVSGAAVEMAYVSITRRVVNTVSIPVAVKVAPYFSAMASMARQLAGVGAKGLVLFNRFYQPDIDVEEMEVVPRLTLSDSRDTRLPLRWIAILYDRIDVSLAANSGIHTGEDVAKMILAGADVTMMASALLVGGPEHLATMRTGLIEIMETKGYSSVDEMRGAMSQKNCHEPAAFERANYIKTLGHFKSTGTRE